MERKPGRSMEANIILYGFREAEGKYGLRYMEMVGDGDSSELATPQKKLTEQHAEHKERAKLTKNQQICMVSARIKSWVILKNQVKLRLTTGNRSSLL